MIKCHFRIVVDEKLNLCMSEGSSVSFLDESIKLYVKLNDEGAFDSMISRPNNEISASDPVTKVKAE